MQLLILGGTAWLGRTIATLAVSAGHQVTCVARGTDVPPGVELIRANRDLDDALAPLAGRSFDAVIDLSRTPGHTRRSVRDLQASVGRYVLVSTVSVYASHEAPNQDEYAALVEALPDSAETGEYGAAKVACEQAVLQGFGPERSVIVRPGLIGGPGDHTGRTVYWQWRFANPSSARGVLVVDDPELPTSIIDVRDLAAFTLSVAVSAEMPVDGPFYNACGHSVPLSEHLALARVASGSEAAEVPAPGEWLIEQDVQQWAGPGSLPLWIAEPTWRGMNQRSIERALAAGMTLRPLAETLSDSLPAHHVEAAGLTDEQERALLAKL